MRKHKETEQEAIERRKQMYGCNGKCCDRVIDPETGEGQYFICGGIDTCDETRVGEFIGEIGAALFFYHCTSCVCDSNRSFDIVLFIGRSCEKND